MLSRLASAELARFELGQSLAHARTPPASWYVLPEVFDLERRRVFASSWRPIARLDQLDRPGAFVAASLGDAPVVALRDEGGVVRAFHNVCRHRAAEVASGQGCVRRLTCPYHGWTYGLDGALAGGPDTSTIEGLDRRGLPPLRVETLGEHVFACNDPAAEPLATQVAGLPARLEGRDRPLIFRERRTYTIACNWKVYVDNYLDGGYHVPTLHRGLAAQIDLSTYATEIFPGWSCQSCGAGRTGGARMGAGALYAWLYPAFMINRYGPALDTNFVVPLAVDRTLTIFDFFFEEGTPDELALESLAMSERVQAEDVAVCESVQRGLASGSYDVGRYGPAEGAALAFHERLAADLRA